MPHHHRQTHVSQRAEAHTATAFHTDPTVPSPEKKNRLLIVTDIDHTIKTENVLWNTPAVPGMPEAFTSWAALASPAPVGEEKKQKNATEGDDATTTATASEKTSGASTDDAIEVRYVYLTNRYGPFSFVGFGPEYFLRSNKFPHGPLHMRSWYDAYGFYQRCKKHKTFHVNRLLLDTEVAVLIGDSTEKDADVYTDYACSEACVLSRKRLLIAIRVIPAKQQQQHKRQASQPQLRFPHARRHSNHHNQTTATATTTLGETEHTGHMVAPPKLLELAEHEAPHHQQEQEQEKDRADFIIPEQAQMLLERCQRRLLERPEADLVRFVTFTGAVELDAAVKRVIGDMKEGVAAYCGK